MLAGDELHIPHDARPDEGANGDGTRVDETPTKHLHDEFLYVKLHATEAADDADDGPGAVPSAVPCTQNQPGL